MSKEIKNKILEAASYTGKMEQHIDADLLQLAQEMRDDGVISLIYLEGDNIKSLQVTLTEYGIEFHKNGGYK